MDSQDLEPINASAVKLFGSSNLTLFLTARDPDPTESAVRFVQRTLIEWVEKLPIRLIDLDRGTIIKTRSTLVSRLQKTLEERRPTGRSFIECVECVERMQWPLMLTKELLPHLKYAILSHRWFTNEPDLVTTAENLTTWLADPNYAFASTPDLGTPPSFMDPGRQKLVTFCKIARDYGYRLAWMDTCCIDKTSSAEYQESINSTFLWYRNADVCIVHLAETEKYKPWPLTQARSLYCLRNIEGRLQVTNKDGESVEWGDEWFSRGWTLQELLAPRVLKFFTSDWEELLPGSQNDKANPQLLSLLERTTDIPGHIIADFNPEAKIPFEKKIRWASSRITTRGEDTAYCLLGIFNISMVILYGEGGENAFFRFQQEYVKIYDDYTIFNWHGKPSSGNSLLASHPKCFWKHDYRYIRSMIWYRSEHFWNRVFVVLGLVWWVFGVNGSPPRFIDIFLNIWAHLAWVWDVISIQTRVIAHVLTYWRNGSVAHASTFYFPSFLFLPGGGLTMPTIKLRESCYRGILMSIINVIWLVVTTLMFGLTSGPDMLGEDPFLSRVAFLNCFAILCPLYWFFTRPIVIPLTSFYKDVFMNIIHRIGMFMTMQPELGFSLTNVGLRLKKEVYNVWAEPVGASFSDQIETYRLIIGRYGSVEVTVNPGEITLANRDSLLAMCFGNNIIILKPTKEVDYQKLSAMPNDDSLVSEHMPRALQGKTSEESLSGENRLDVVLRSTTRATDIWTKVHTNQAIRSGISPMHVRGSRRLIYVR